MIRTYLLRALMMLMLLTPMGGCTISYKLNGAAIDYQVYKTIYVSQFPIRAALVYPPLQPTFENELLDYITLFPYTTLFRSCNSKAKSPVTRSHPRP